MTMLKRSPPTDSRQMEFPLISSAEDSPAKTSSLLDLVQDLPVSAADSGSSSTGSSRKSARRGSSSKTSAPFALADWSKCSGASLRSGTMRSGTVYPLPPLAPLTAGTEFGSLPTPSGVGSNRKNHVMGRLDEWGGSSNPFRGTEVGKVRCASFEEWMMGFPTGWTAPIRFATRLSRKSQR